MEIIVARHCQTDWNALGRIQGQSDIRLNEAGREQARTLAKELAKFKIAKKYSSDMSRAIETAQMLPSNPSYAILDCRLRECHFGWFEGQTKEEIAKKYPRDLWDTLVTRDFASHYTFNEVRGENCGQVMQRHLSFFNELLEEFDGSSKLGLPLVIGHGRSLGTFLAHLGAPTELEQGSFQIIRYPKF